MYVCIYIYIHMCVYLSLSLSLGVYIYIYIYLALYLRHFCLTHTRTFCARWYDNPARLVTINAPASLALNPF